MRPDASVTNDDLPGTLDALKSDGTLVQTVIGVLAAGRCCAGPRPRPA